LLVGQLGVWRLACRENAMRRSALVTGAFTILAAAAVAGAAPAAAGDGASVQRPQCGFTPGHFPGVDVEILSTSCLVVATPGGVVNAHFTAQVPEGYTVAPGIYPDGPCTSTVTPTGRITNVCHFR
jgi:hypothetical protein